MQLKTYKLPSRLILGCRIKFLISILRNNFEPICDFTNTKIRQKGSTSQICNQCIWRHTNFLQKLDKKVQIHKHTTNKQIWLENLKTSIYINFRAKNPFLITINSQCKHGAKQQHLQHLTANTFGKLLLHEITWVYFVIFLSYFLANLVICDFFRLSFLGLGIGAIVALLVACLSEYSDDFTSSIISFM